MRVDQFQFDLPESQIALAPADPPEAARLLLVPASGSFGDLRVAELPGQLRAGDVMVFNDTRVIPALLSGHRPARDGTSPPIALSVMLHKRAGPDAWWALVRPAKRLKTGDRVSFGAGLAATVTTKGEAGEVLFSFDQTGADLDAAIALHGAPPLPPYILDRRGPDPRDKERYQTRYARVDGSVAAPTAGLHFTDALLAKLDAAGVERHFVTLHVGAGTFLPVKTADTKEHKMHAETREVSVEAAAALNRARAEGRRIVAVGTTALRTLESAVDADGQVMAVQGDTDLFITPGFDFRVVDGLWTNFHLPSSTLLMLVAAFGGYERTMAAYAHAVQSGYRFYSFGDASLWWRAG